MSTVGIVFLIAGILIALAAFLLALRNIFKGSRAVVSSFSRSPAQLLGEAIGSKPKEDGFIAQHLKYVAVFAVGVAFSIIGVVLIVTAR
jgi:hypothetical protein